MRKTTYALILLSFFFSAASFPHEASPVRIAQGETKVDFNIPKQSLADALAAWSKQSGLQVLRRDNENAVDLEIRGVSGKFSPAEALEQMLAATGLTYEFVNDRTVRVAPARTNAQTTSYSPDRKENTGMTLAQNTGRQSTNEASAEDKKNSGTPAGDSETKLQEIIVTGSHIRGISPVGSDVKIITREEILSSGHGRIQDVLETLPQNFSGSAGEDGNAELRTQNFTGGQAVDLRGLGSNSTLVLVNGHRQAAGGLLGSFVDISSIPASAIERIEVLTDGASALYGSDAIGGVINFVLRKDYRGLEASARGARFGGGTAELQGAIVGGTEWSTGESIFGYQHSNRESLMMKDTPYGSANRDFRSFGGSDFRTTFGAPGTILNTAGQPAYAIPGGQDGTRLTVADLIPGQSNYQDQVTDITALPEQISNSVFLSVTQNLTDRFEIFVDGRYGRRKFEQSAAGTTATLSVPSTNPFYINPFGGAGPVRVNFDFRNVVGLTTNASTTDTYTTAAGGTLKLSHDWQIKVSGDYAHETNSWRQSNGINTARRTACLSGLTASGCPGRPLNVFGDASNNDPLTINYIRSTNLGDAASTIRSVTVIGDGSLYAMHGGQVKLAVGVDYRHEGLEATSGTLADYTGVVTADSAIVGDLSRDVKATFAELAIPFFSAANEVPGIQSLKLSMAARYERYSDFGSTTNPKVGLDYVPINGLRLRTTWGTSFRAPRFNELSSSLNTSNSLAFLNVVDPRSASGRSDVLAILGGKADLDPETAKIWTAGFDAEFPWAEGLDFSGTYFNIEYKNKIQMGGALNNTLAFESQWVDIITRNPTAAQVIAVCSRSDFLTACPASPAAILDLTLRNLGGLKTSGVDANIRYTTSLHFGQLTLGLSETYLLTYARASTADSPFVGALDTVGNPLASKLRGTLAWAYDGWSANAAVNHAGGYDDPARSRLVEAWTTADFGVGYRFGQTDPKGIGIQVSVVNVFDKRPPFVNQVFGYDAANGSQVGRAVSLNLTSSW